MSLLPFYQEDVIEIGVDEAGRGPLFGRVYAGAVIWPTGLTSPLVKDSKKLKESDREKSYKYVVENAIAWGFGYVEPEEIDATDIYRAVMKAMHEAIRQTCINPQHILVDGNSFRPFMDQYGETPPFTTVIKGDDRYYSVAAGSIIAKVEHDHYINEMCDRYPILEQYDLRHNKGYGTDKHFKAILKCGVTQFHRRSFKGCAGVPCITI
jgi:ribonuclease HII